MAVKTVNLVKYAKPLPRMRIVARGCSHRVRFLIRACPAALPASPLAVLGHQIQIDLEPRKESTIDEALAHRVIAQFSVLHAVSALVIASAIVQRTAAVSFFAADLTSLPTFNRFVLHL